MLNTMFPAYIILSSMLAWIAILSNVSCYAEECRDHVLGSTIFTTPKVLPRVYLEPFKDRATFSVPKLCVNTQAVKAHACAADIAPYVEVYNFKTVNVHRKGAPEAEIYIDITAYCNAWNFKNQNAYGYEAVPLVAPY